MADEFSDMHDDDEDTEVMGGFNGRDGVIFLIDADKSLTGDPMQFRNCMECIRNGMKNRIITSNKDLVGLSKIK